MPTPSGEQQNIIDCVKEGFNVLVDAVAGSGKTIHRFTPRESGSRTRHSDSKSTV